MRAPAARQLHGAVTCPSVELLAFRWAEEPGAKGNADGSLTAGGAHRSTLCSGALTAILAGWLHGCRLLPCSLHASSLLHAIPTTTSCATVPPTSCATVLARPLASPCAVLVGLLAPELLLLAGARVCGGGRGRRLHSRAIRLLGCRRLRLCTLRLWAQAG